LYIRYSSIIYVSRNNDEFVIGTTRLVTNFQTISVTCCLGDFKKYHFPSYALNEKNDVVFFHFLHSQHIIFERTNLSTLYWAFLNLKFKICKGRYYNNVLLRLAYNAADTFSGHFLTCRYCNARLRKMLSLPNYELRTFYLFEF